MQEPVTFINNTKKTQNKTTVLSTQPLHAIFSHALPSNWLQPWGYTAQRLKEVQSVIHDQCAEMIRRIRIINVLPLWPELYSYGG